MLGGGLLVSIRLRPIAAAISDPRTMPVQSSPGTVEELVQLENRVKLAAMLTREALAGKVMAATPVGKPPAVASETHQLSRNPMRLAKFRVRMAVVCRSVLRRGA